MLKNSSFLFMDLFKLGICYAPCIFLRIEVKNLYQKYLKKYYIYYFDQDKFYFIVNYFLSATITTFELLF